MNENKINAICQECDKQFEYNLKPGYPRKYCVECSEIKKATYAAKISPDEQKFNEDMQVPVVKLGNVGSNPNPDTPLIVPQKAPVSLEYEIRERQVRSNALRCAIEANKAGLAPSKEPDSLLQLAKEFEEYIRNGN